MSKNLGYLACTLRFVSNLDSFQLLSTPFRIAHQTPDKSCEKEASDKKTSFLIMRDNFLDCLVSSPTGLCEDEYAPSSKSRLKR